MKHSVLMMMIALIYSIERNQNSIRDVVQYLLLIHLNERHNVFRCIRTPCMPEFVENDFNRRRIVYLKCIRKTTD